MFSRVNDEGHEIEMSSSFPGTVPVILHGNPCDVQHGQMKACGGDVATVVCWRDCRLNALEGLLPGCSQAEDQSGDRLQAHPG